jgi:hypothetical protein
VTCAWSDSLRPAPDRAVLHAFAPRLFGVEEAHRVAAARERPAGRKKGIKLVLSKQANSRASIPIKPMNTIIKMMKAAVFGSL